MARPLILFLASVAFALAHGQAPLYYSNQNQYFLQGLANADFGFLADDWLARTEDPTPLFSGLVAITARLFQPWVFHVYYFALQAVYLTSLVGLFSFLAKARDTNALRLSFLALVIAVHSAPARWASQRLLGLDYPWYLQAGVAGQYSLGAMFQPSTFGVLLIAAVALFLHGKPYFAGCCLATAATVHTTHLLPAAFLTCGFLWVLCREGQPKQAARLGGSCFLLVLPVVIFSIITFQPTSAETFQAAQHILVHFRIPHHCLPELWLDGIALFQIGWMLTALFLSRGSRLFAVLAVCLSLAAALTLLQAATGSDTLALLFPWRVSAVLMPLATGIILTRLVLAAAAWLERRETCWTAGGVIAGFAAGGLLIMSQGAGYQTSDDEVPVMNYVWENKQKREVYLVPVSLPDLKRTTRGSLSGDFKPLKAKQMDKRLIPGDFQRFRLYTEAPIFADFKAIPYKDVEVIEWRERLDRAALFYDRIDKGRVAEVRDALRAAGITHIIVPADRDLGDRTLTKRYDDGKYAVYELP